MNSRRMRNKIKYLTLLPILLAMILLVIIIVQYGIDSRETIITAIIVAAYILIVLFAYNRLMPVFRSTMVDYSLEQGKVQKELLHGLAVPYVLMDMDGKVMWANAKFYRAIEMNEKKFLQRRIDSYIPDLTPEALDDIEGEISMDVDLHERKYNAVIRRVDLSTVFGEDSSDKEEDLVLVMHMFDVTNEKRLEQETYDQKLIAGLVYIDNYDEVMNSLEEVKHSILTALVDRKINMYLTNIDAIVRHLENDKYLFVFRQKYMQTLKSDRFSLLDDVKSINVGNDIPMTLSIGIGAGSETFTEAFENAKVAIGLALGRGGDQVALKFNEQVSYYGGKSTGTEKTTRVKARVKAQAFEELLENKEKVLIMAHKRPDADAFGSAVGIHRLVTTLGRKAYIVLNGETDAIAPLVNSFKNSNVYSDMIVSSGQALSMVDASTMVVVCDVNRPSMTECEELLEMVSTVVVFDHHRQSNEPIENATLSYIEPFASSACEMITEMFQYISVKPKIRPVEADAMYSGILIDTDNFLNKTGVRTFEAASYLRKSGADITRVRKMFRSSLVSMKERAQGISNAEIYMGCYALSYVEPDPASSEAPTVPVAKAANELLNVEDVKASFVVTEGEDGILYVSARSIGDVNVQLVMERFNGGGHATVAGAQVKDTTKEEFFLKLRHILKQMSDEGSI
ncbi:MAG: DHH family phosphoesterase [Eubacterium sp.]|nr:DHH family phosphoesterase [Eubacterium sp.]